MDMYWLLLNTNACSFAEIQKRQCIAIAWPELGTLEKYIREKPDWERQFKGYLQIRGDLAYGRESSWMNVDRHFDQVPDIFWQLLKIKKGDIVVAVESGNELTFGRPVIRGIARINHDAIHHYQYNEKYHHAHSVCPKTTWFPWDNFTMGELQMPHTNFRALLADNEQIHQVMEGWKVAARKAKEK
ncbi:MAG: hypothetical protein ACRBBR_05425 [Cellvibrionaceae bacterium]